MLGPGTIRAVAYKEQLHGKVVLPQPVEDLDYIRGVLYRSKIGDVDDDFFTIWAQSSPKMLLVKPAEALRIDEVRDYLNVRAYIKTANRLVTQENRKQQ